MIGTCTRRGSTSPKGWRSTRSEPGRDGRGTLVSPPEIVSVAIGFEVGPTLDPNTLVLNDPVRGLLDTGELGEANAFVTVTDDMRRITVIRGAQRVDSPVIRYETGTAEIVMDNADRRYDPENLNGPYVDRKSTRLNSSHVKISYAAFCLSKH